MHGCVELRTERLILRRYRPEDADDLYHYLGTDPAMYEHSGWNPYATLELAQETVRRFIDCYKDGHTYSWVMDMGADQCGIPIRVSRILHKEKGFESC